jgi:microcin C transport system permease protein
LIIWFWPCSSYSKLGQLLSEATEFHVKAPWIGISVISSLVVILTMVTFIGEAVREAFDPKMYTTYE